MTRALSARLTRLETAKSAKVPNVLFVVGCRWQPKIEMVGNVAYLRPALTEHGFAELARKQQAALLATLNEVADTLGQQKET